MRACMAFPWPRGQVRASREVVATAELRTPKWCHEAEACQAGEREHPLLGSGLPRLGTAWTAPCV